MSFEIWLAFIMASAVVLIIPGPTILLVTSIALGKGRQAALISVPGVMLGDFIAMTISLLGAGAILASSAQLFTLLKFAGAAYLIWLGFKMWRSAPGAYFASQQETKQADTGFAQPARQHHTLFWQAALVTALNPKGIIFFIAFVPHFITASAPALPQFIILEASFVILAGLNALIWAIFAAHLRQKINSPRISTWVTRLGGSFMFAAAALTLSARRVSS